MGIGGKVLKGKTERPACASSAGEINYLRNRGNWSYQHLGISSPGMRAYVCVCGRERGMLYVRENVCVLMHISHTYARDEAPASGGATGDQRCTYR